MILKIHRLARAEEDLTEIWRYSFETWGEAQADRYYDALVQGIDLLAKNPDIGTTCDDISRLNDMSYSTRLLLKS